jgi:hypothetical protein
MYAGWEKRTKPQHEQVEMSDAGENDRRTNVPNQADQPPCTGTHPPGIKVMNGDPGWKTTIAAISPRHESEVDFILVAIEKAGEQGNYMLSSSTAEMGN